jgi:hypothetical protein
VSSRLSRAFHRTIGALGGFFILYSPAQASTAPVADPPQGQVLGVGLSGISWDYGWARHSLGFELRSTNTLPTGSGDRFLIGSRGTWRLADSPDLNVAALVGFQLDPGVPGSRAYLIPDVGLGVAYRFFVGPVPLGLRFNVTLTLNQGQTGGVFPIHPSPDPYPLPPTGNLLQRLTLGPNTTLGLVLRAHDRYEITLGGGTLIGLRVQY